MTDAKLSDMQLVLLATAVQREDGSLLPPSPMLGNQGARMRKAVAGLIKRALVDEVEVTDPDCFWREEGDRHIGIVISDAGRTIIAAEEAKVDGGEAATAPDAIVAAAAPEAVVAEPDKPTTKSAQVVALLQRADGATLAELAAATGWLPHTTRAALTGLRKKGHAIAKDKRGDVTCYRITAAA